MRNLKDLFIKPDDDEEEKKEKENPSFPIKNSTTSSGTPSSDNPYLVEIIEVYEKGFESMNMPGYDFYDFYITVKAAGSHTETVYKMAFQMGKTMDANVTPQKLAADAEYYLSKINEVHQRFSDQGRQKMEALSSQLQSEAASLSAEASQIESEINKLKQQIQVLDKKLASTKEALSKVDGKYKPQHEVIHQKLKANDHAKEISVQKINSIKEGLEKFLK